MDYIVIGTLGSVFSAYLVGFGYPLSFVTHLSVLHWTLLYLHPSYQSLTSFEPTYFIVLHDLTDSLEFPAGSFNKKYL